MGRRNARKAALQAIFQMDVGNAQLDQALEFTTNFTDTSGEDLQFAGEIARGVLENKETIDRVISSLSREWDLERLARVDLSILRLALYEIMFREDIPASVSVNEAVELSKVFSGEDSGRFINGILGGVLAADKETRG